ncbi:hypothetical protein HUN92_22530 [Bacillus firmus]|uniref:hypothetical protein n=1 Tax=Cytobacillus firmus TaxID=1399 RepID=UPI0015810B10|nr:hypothetical protein [Cytobacillus firmus]MED1908850.1 hypothetical protein [Cytobacillus firmus]NUH86415.1 hypothetical protein [Cytobacillus firmus]
MEIEVLGALFPLFLWIMGGCFAILLFFLILFTEYTKNRAKEFVQEDLNNLALPKENK